MKHPIATRPARGNPLAHGHFRPVRSERRGKAAWPGASAHGHLAQLGRGEGAMPASRHHGGAALLAGRRSLLAGSGQAGERTGFVRRWRMRVGN